MAAAAVAILLSGVAWATLGLQAGLLALASLAVLAALLGVGGGAKKPKPQCSDGDAKSAAAEEWDYVIVGGGTAGCLLANRLTNGTGKRVLMLEAGTSSYDDKRIRIPSGVLQLFQTKFDWHFISEKDPATADKGIYFCRGKVLGGSSSLNVLLYNRGDAKDYDDWASQFGIPEWTAAQCLQYFTCSHDDHSGKVQSDPKHHGQGGEWKVDHVRYQNDLSKLFLKACAENELPLNDDFNNWDRSQAGAGRFTVSEHNGERCSAASAFLAPALQRSADSLRVLCGALVRRVVLDDSGSAAVGVEFSAGEGGPARVVRIAKGGEVIMAAGAIQTPQLLMLSGLGPEKHLREHGIKVVKDLPGVGQNLQDHPAVNVSCESSAAFKGVSVTSHFMFIFGQKVPHPKWILQWFLFKTGLLTSVGCDHGGFFHTAAGKGRESPDLQMRFLPARAVTADGMNSFAKFRTTRSLPDGYTFQSIAARPFSRGSVSLASSDPKTKPIVKSGYLTDKRDVATLREGIKMARTMASKKAFDVARGREVFPGPEVQTDAQIDAYIADTVHTANALVGTCRMGRPSDPMAVCDSDMKVLGMQGLRICDASIMPTLPGGQTGAAVVMIGERAAETILSQA